MRGVRRAERMFHMAVKQVTMPGGDEELHERWVTYMIDQLNTVAYLRMRGWEWEFSQWHGPEVPQR